MNSIWLVSRSLGFRRLDGSHCSSGPVYGRLDHYRICPLHHLANLQRNQRTAQCTLAQSTTSIYPWYVPRSFSLVKPCWVTEVVDGTQVPNTPIRTTQRTLRQNLRDATIEKLQQATTKRKNPWIRKETKGFRQSGRRDSNPRPLPPQGSALARLRYGPMFRRFQQQTCRPIAQVDRLVKQPRV